MRDATGRHETRGPGAPGELLARMGGQALAVCYLLVLAAPPAALADSVETVDVRRFDGKILRIDADSVVIEGKAGQEVLLPREEVHAVNFASAADPMAHAGQCVVIGADGDILTAAGARSANGKLAFTNAALGACELPLSRVRMIYLPDTGLTCRDMERACRELKVDDVPMDALIVRRKADDFLTVEGVLKDIGQDEIVFNYRGQDGKVPRKTVLAIRLAGAAPASQPATAGRLVTSDGSVLTFSKLALNAESLDVHTPHLGPRRLGAASIASVQFTSDSVVELAVLEPDAVKEYGFFDSAFTHRVNRSASGRPLALDGREYACGLGLHSFCELTWRLDAKYATFAALAGINDSVRPSGDAVLTIVGDGKELAEPLRLTGKDKARPIRLKVSGVRELTIRVDFGADGLDAADHVDVVAARLIKSP